MDVNGCRMGKRTVNPAPPHVGAGHARPGGVRRTGVCGKPAGRACPAPTARQQGRCESARKVPREGQDPPLRTDKNVCLMGKCTPSHTPPHVGAGHARPGGVRRTGACGKPAGRACPAPTARRQGECEPARKVPREGQDPPLRTDGNVCLMGKCTPSHTPRT